MVKRIDMRYIYKCLILCSLFFFSVSVFSQVLITEDFDGGTSFPSGWSSPTLPAFSITSSQSCSGNSARGPLNVNSVSPELVFMSQDATGSDIDITLDYKILENGSFDATDEDFGKFDLQYSIDDGKNWITYYTIDDTTHTPSTSCATITHTLTGVDVPAGSEFGWRIKGSYTQGDNFIYIDNFEAVEDVACKQPIDVVVEDVTFDSIELSWTEFNSTPATEWEVAFCPEGIDPDNPACFLNNIETTTSNPHTITGLDDGTVYDIYVRSVCSSSSSSAWTGPIRVQTIAIGTDCANPYEISSLPFTHTSDTEIYDNIYSGSPGSSCATAGNYLDGYDVVYKYTTGSTGDIIQIELSGNLDGAVGVFVYESCDDIGRECFAGAITDDGSDFGISDLYVDANTDYYIVVSTSGSTSSTEYTLDISGFDCAGWNAPSGDSTFEFYNQTLADYSDTRIGINPTISGASLKWYSDSGLTSEITDLSSITLSNGDEFWVVQEVLGCTSPSLHVTFTEFDCNDLSITNVEALSMICDEGTTVLEATADSENLIWYAEEFGGEPIGVGSSIRTPVLTETTSFWVSEFFRGEGNLYQQANPGPVSSNDSSVQGGVEFELFEPTVLIDVQVYITGAGGDMTIQLLDDKGGLQERTINVPSGSVTSPTPFVLPLDFEINDINDGPFRLVKSSGPSMLGTPSSSTDYPYAIGNVGTVTSGVSGSSTTSDYYYFYNWTVISSVALCESDRIEVEAVVNETLPISIDAASYDVCVGSEAHLNAVSDDEDYVYTWEWVDEQGVSQSVQGDSIAPILEQGTNFTVYAENPNTGCTTEEEIFIDVVGVGNVPVNPSEVSICAGEVIMLYAGEITQAFEEDPITGWTFVNNSTPASGVDASKGDWKQVSSPYNLADNATSNDNSKFMIASADALGPGSEIDSEMISPPLNLVGVSDASLEFYQYYRHLSTKSTTAEVLVSDDAGLTWNSVASYNSNRGSATNFEKVTIDLSDYIGSANVQIKFSYTGGWGWWWAIDNVSVVQTYANGQVMWQGSDSQYLYLDEDASVPYNGELTNVVYFSSDQAGNYEFDIDLYIEGCSSPVINSISVEVNDASIPVGDSEQEFSAGARVSEIDVQGQNLRYYLLEDGEYIRQSVNATLVDGETYYITQTIGDCTSDYLEVTVSFVCPEPTDLTVTVNLSEDGTSASAIIFWEHPVNMTTVEGYQLILKDIEGQIIEDLAINAKRNYVIVELLSLEEDFSVELYTICDESSGVFSDALEEEFNTHNLGLEDFKTPELQYYPNPVEDILHISSSISIEKLEVITLEGKRVFVMNNIDNTETQLDLSSLSTGTYLVVATTQGKYQVLRVVKK